MQHDVAFVILVVIPVLMIAVPLLLAYRKDRKARRAALGRSPQS